MTADLGAPILAAVLMMGAFLCGTLYFLGWERLERLSSRRRMQAFVQNRPAGATGGEGQRSFNERVLQPFFASLGQPILRLTPVSMINSTRQSLNRAGMTIDPTAFLGIRLGCLVVGAVLGSVVSATGNELPDPLRIGLPFLAAAFGYALPGIFLGSAVGSRQKSIRKVLPTALEILAVAIEAGLAFDGAIAHVSQRLKGPLSDELRRMFVEFQMGRARRIAMQDFAARTGLPETERFVAAVVQAEAMGVPLSKALSDLAFEQRTLQRQRAETSARTAPIKMMFPLVLLIFPALFIIILGPACATLFSRGGLGA